MLNVSKLILIIFCFQSERISYEEMYNVDESSLFGKYLPTRTVEFESEWQANSHMSTEEYVKMITHTMQRDKKVKVVMIGKF